MGARLTIPAAEKISNVLVAGMGSTDMQHYVSKREDIARKGQLRVKITYFYVSFFWGNKFWGTPTDCASHCRREVT